MIVVLREINIEIVVLVVVIEGISTRNRDVLCYEQQPSSIPTLAAYRFRASPPDPIKQYIFDNAGKAAVSL